MLDCKSKALLRVEIDGFHHQRVSFPAADGIAQPGAETVVERSAAESDYASVVIHFHQDHDIVLILHDPVVVVVQHRQHGRSPGGAETDQASFAQRALLRPVVSGLLPVSHEGEAGRFGIGNPAVGGIDNEGSAIFAHHSGEPGTGVDPERVVPRVGIAVGRRRTIRVARSAVEFG